MTNQVSESGWSSPDHTKPHYVLTAVDANVYPLYNHQIGLPSLMLRIIGSHVTRNMHTLTILGTLHKLDKGLVLSTVVN